MESNDSEWIEIVPAQPFRDADARFTQWLTENRIERAAIANDDVRIDTVRTDAGSTRRYLIKRLSLLDLLARRTPEQQRRGQVRLLLLGRGFGEAQTEFGDASKVLAAVLRALDPSGKFL